MGNFGSMGGNGTPAPANVPAQERREKPSID